MSKVKAKDIERQPNFKEKNSTGKKKKKYWFKLKLKKKTPPRKDQETPKAQQLAPPVDAQQFSANWKALQEVWQSKYSLYILYVGLFSISSLLPTTFSLIFPDIKG